MNPPILHPTPPHPWTHPTPLKKPSPIESLPQASYNMSIESFVVETVLQQGSVFTKKINSSDKSQLDTKKVLHYQLVASSPHTDDESAKYRTMQRM